MWTAATLQSAAWALCQMVLVVLSVYLFRTGNYRQYPYFTAYTLLNLGQGAVLFSTYHSWGYWGSTTYVIGWFTIGLTFMARALAVAELCRRVLKGYRGIWELAWRLLLFCAVAIITYSFLVANWHWEQWVVAADRGLELAVAGVIVLLFVFSRYYQLPISGPDRSLAAGFCVYSCVVVLNHTILERFFHQYYPFWNLFILLAFFGAVSAWIRALRFPAPAKTEHPELVEAAVYRRLSPEINLRLRMLNEQLLTLWKVEAPHP